MTKYTSRYPELAFYVDGVGRKFSAGEYIAQTDEEVAVLNRLSDVRAVVEEKPKQTEEPAEEPTVSEVTEPVVAPEPEPEKPARKGKAAANTSAK